MGVADEEGKEMEEREQDLMRLRISPPNFSHPKAREPLLDKEVFGMLSVFGNHKLDEGAKFVLIPKGDDPV